MVTFGNGDDKNGQEEANHLSIFEYVCGVCLRAGRYVRSCSCAWVSVSAGARAVVWPGRVHARVRV